MVNRSAKLPCFILIVAKLLKIRRSVRVYSLLEHGTCVIKWISDTDLLSLPANWDREVSRGGKIGLVNMPTRLEV